MNILIVGAGGVGSAVASIIETRSFYKKVILADFDASVSQAALDALSFGAKAVRIIDGTDPDSFASALAGTGGTLVVA